MGTTQSTQMNSTMMNSTMMNSTMMNPSCMQYIQSCNAELNILLQKNSVSSMQLSTLAMQNNDLLRQYSTLQLQYTQIEMTDKKKLVMMENANQAKLEMNISSIQGYVKNTGAPYVPLPK